VFTILLICIITGIIVGCAFSIYIKNYIDPTIDESLLATGGTSQTTQIYYYNYEDIEARQNRTGDAVELEDQRLYGEQNSLWADYADIPQDLKDAFVAIEDKRFWDHSGVDWIRTGSAVLKFFVGNSSYGGSSITQQLVKNLTSYDDVTIQRKVQEIVCALNLEKTKSKEEILELYLNIIPLSQRCYGVQSAANTYFGKDVSELSLIECVCIASITNAPTRYDPVQNPENNQERRDSILEEMLAQGYITQEEFDSAYDKELTLNLTEVSTTISTNSWYTDTVIEDVISDLMETYNYTRQVASQKIYSGGLQIYTLMDPEVQNALDEVFCDDSIFEKALKKEVSGVPAESAMVITDPYTGDLLGIVGGRGVKTENRILNLASQSVRASGSSIKPLAV
ncbi:MAG: transglycosylase domain-containing protein, partial [Clostridia bacterium]|nr:transglycosylase domain-containing protein [Clostridia bacterium]